MPRSCGCLRSSVIVCVPKERVQTLIGYQGSNVDVHGAYFIGCAFILKESLTPRYLIIPEMKPNSLLSVCVHTHTRTHRETETETEGGGGCTHTWKEVSFRSIHLMKQREECTKKKLKQWRQLHYLKIPKRNCPVLQL